MQIYLFMYLVNVHGQLYDPIATLDGIQSSNNSKVQTKNRCPDSPFPTLKEPCIIHKGPVATLAQSLGEESGFKSPLEEGQSGSRRNPGEWEMCQRAGAETEKEP